MTRFNDMPFHDLMHVIPYSKRSFLNEFNWKATTFNDWHSSIEYCLTLSYGNLILLSRTLTLCIVLFIYVFFPLKCFYFFLHFCVLCACTIWAVFSDFFASFFISFEFSYFFLLFFHSCNSCKYRQVSGLNSKYGATFSEDYQWSITSHLHIFGRFCFVCNFENNSKMLF